MWFKNEYKNKLILTKNGCGILILNCGFKMYLQIGQRQNVNYGKKTIELSNMRTFALKNHMRYKKHKDLESKKTSGNFLKERNL